MSKNYHHEERDKLLMLQDMVENAEKNIKSAQHLLAQLLPHDAKTTKRKKVSSDELTEGIGKIVEGTFDGEGMVGSDGKHYPIPANYASKSKLIEGDTLKLTIMPDGSFVYKQIGPADRETILGTLMQNDSNEFHVVSNGASYKVLLASVTYHKGAVGDQVTLVIPTTGKPVWGAIENIIKDMTNIAAEGGNSVGDIQKEHTPNIDDLEKELSTGAELL